MKISRVKNGKIEVRGDIFVAEYSPNQNAFHHQSLADSIRDGIHHVSFGAGAKGYDWIVFFVGTEQEAYDAIESMRNYHDKKE